MDRAGSGPPYCESCHDVGWIRYRTRPASAIPGKHRFSSRKRLNLELERKKMPGLRSPHGGSARPHGVDAFPRQRLRCVARAPRTADLVAGIRTVDHGRSDSERVEVVLSPTRWPSQCDGGLTGRPLAQRHNITIKKLMSFCLLNSVHSIASGGTSERPAVGKVFRP